MSGESRFLEPVEFELAIRRIQAEAWEAGFARGFYDHLAGGVRDASESEAINPYTREDGGEDE